MTYYADGIIKELDFPNLGSRTLRSWLDKRRKACKTNPQLQNKTDQMLEIRQLKKELAEAKRKMNS